VFVRREPIHERRNRLRRYASVSGGLVAEQLEWLRERPRFVRGPWQDGRESQRHGRERQAITGRIDDLGERLAMPREGSRWRGHGDRRLDGQLRRGPCVGRARRNAVTPRSAARWRNNCSHSNGLARATQTRTAGLCEVDGGPLGPTHRTGSPAPTRARDRGAQRSQVRPTSPYAA
jgi:hypothetical protein